MMGAPLDEKGLDAAKAWFDAEFNGLPDDGALTQGIIRAYLSATPAIAVSQPIGDGVEALMRERTSLIATKREQIDRLTARAETAEAQVKRLTEEKEALRGGVEHVETLSELLKIIKEHWIDYDHVFSIAVDEADKFVAARATLNSREKAE